MQRFRIGSVGIVPLVQLTYLPPPSRFFAQLEEMDAHSSAWWAQPPYRDQSSGGLTIDMGGFLVTTPSRTLLVDLGIGNDKHRPNPVFDHRSDDWLGQLATAGARPDDVDFVVFTHLHVDHVGNATRLVDGQWAPTFPRARHLTTAAEWAFWTSPASGPEADRLGDYVADSVLPLERAGLLDLVPADLQLSPEVRLRPAPGHTPGNVCVEVASEGARAVFCGDMVHHPAQLAFPDWSTKFCIDTEQAAAARRALLEAVADTEDWLIPAHFPGSLPCRVHRRGDAYDFTPVVGEPL